MQNVKGVCHSNLLIRKSLPFHLRRHFQLNSLFLMLYVRRWIPVMQKYRQQILHCIVPQRTKSNVKRNGSRFEKEKDQIKSNFKHCFLNKKKSCYIFFLKVQLQNFTHRNLLFCLHLICGWLLCQLLQIFLFLTASYSICSQSKVWWVCTKRICIYKLVPNFDHSLIDHC